MPEQPPARDAIEANGRFSKMLKKTRVFPADRKK